MLDHVDRGRILQDRDLRTFTGDISRPGVWRVGFEEQRHRLAVVGDRELHLLRP